MASQSSHPDRENKEWNEFPPPRPHISSRQIDAAQTKCEILTCTPFIILPVQVVVLNNPNSWLLWSTGGSKVLLRRNDDFQDIPVSRLLRAHQIETMTTCFSSTSRLLTGQEDFLRLCRIKGRRAWPNRRTVWFLLEIPTWQNPWKNKANQ